MLPFAGIPTTVTVDGAPLLTNQSDFSPYYQESSFFSTQQSKDDPVFVGAGDVLTPCFDVGYYAELPPLAPGQHTIDFGGMFPDGTVIDGNYSITVAGR